jgi:hypothetical protein
MQCKLTTIYRVLLFVMWYAVCCLLTWSLFQTLRVVYWLFSVIYGWCDCGWSIPYLPGEVTLQMCTEDVANEWTPSMSSVTCHTSICGIIIHISFHFSNHSIHIIVICFGSDKGLLDIMSVRRNLRLYYSWTGHCSLGTILTYMCNTRL